MNKVGLVCMAHDQTKENANQSQFFITLRGEDLDHLDGNYTIFGEIAEGLDVLEKLNELYCDGDGRPYQDVRIKHTYILDDPFPDPSGMDGLVPPASPEKSIPNDEKVRKRIPYEEGISTDVDPGTEAELEQRIRAQEAKSRAIVLEMTGDIPDADVKPPDEVLFVCKLNNVTTDADLELIFSRFGTIKQCEIIRDFKTGDSLSYAFIEFETSEACIEAYEKMNNVLVDDRRIKVDFSQSVSQLWNRFLSKPRDNKKKGMQQQHQEPFQPPIKKPQQQQSSHYESQPTDRARQDSRKNSSENGLRSESKEIHRSNSVKPLHEKRRVDKGVGADIAEAERGIEIEMGGIIEEEKEMRITGGMEGTTEEIEIIEEIAIKGEMIGEKIEETVGMEKGVIEEMIDETVGIEKDTGIEVETHINLVLEGVGVD
eukprot:CAMPEP_0119053668 /NCGR_PEP_ID=MMETSP1177-20130426/74573_1 /TAXON_ID=2985 /ORGANISM="Ochromonas sp, Strain CCMP1899" /LENGTH=427 /DNA_ID=CAMNT_0007033677 /DNA_START=415 /DNA_END=1696 /DNA_ORIENTATION=-